MIGHVLGSGCSSLLLTGEEKGVALLGMEAGTNDEDGVGRVGGLKHGRGGGAGGQRRRECFTAVSLYFCTTHQNSAACRQELGGRADSRSVLRVVSLPLSISTHFLLLDRLCGRQYSTTPVFPSFYSFSLQHPFFCVCVFF